MKPGRAIAIETIGEIQKSMAGMADELAKGAHKARQKMSDDEIRRDIAFRKSADGDGPPVKPENITDDEVKKHRAMSVEEIRADIQKATSDARSNIASSWSFQWEVFKSGLSIFTLLWLFLGVGSAYRLAAADTSDSLG